MNNQQDVLPLALGLALVFSAALALTMFAIGSVVW